MAVYDPKRLYTFLSELNLFPKDQLDRSYIQSQQEQIPFDQTLLEHEVVSDENLGKAIADILNVPFIVLSKLPISADILRLIPEVVARKEYCIAYGKDERGLLVAMYDPMNLPLKQQIAKTTGWPVVAAYATKLDIEDAFAQYTTNAVTAFTDILKSASKNGKDTQSPVIAIVDTIIKNGYENRTSDIHIEPYEKTSLVRYRIDGVLHDIVRLPEELHEQIVTRIKVMSAMRTDEHQAAQDGKIAFPLSSSEKLDIRASVVPIEEGEKVVMRLLSERSRQFTIADLGFSGKDFDSIQKALKKPFGMILVTGPTGSGKTTTLYALVKQLNNRAINIMTIEDPVEYDIPGVNQIQVNQRTNLTFAAGLKSIVRQDPDVILVGEIRDEETAGIAVNSAMTGHLVLSTIHANDAATTLPRLFDFSVEPFLIASTVNALIAQRLVRKICMQCRVSEEISATRLKELGMPSAVGKDFPQSGGTVRLYRGKGCPVCHATGYEGRIGIFEVMPMDDAVRKAILEKKDASDIRAIAIVNGMTTMMQDGWKKALEGLTTMDEIIRVTKE